MTSARAATVDSGDDERHQETDNDRDIRDVEGRPEPKIDEIDDRTAAEHVGQIPGSSAESRTQAEGRALSRKPAQPEV